MKLAKYRLQSGEEGYLLDVTKGELNLLGEALDLIRYALGFPHEEYQEMMDALHDAHRQEGEYREMADRIYAEVTGDDEILRQEGLEERPCTES